MLQQLGMRTKSLDSCFSTQPAHALAVRYTYVHYAVCSAVMLATGLVYYLRLSDYNRMRMSEELEELTKPSCVGAVSLTAIMDAETKLYIDNVRLEDGIAQNKALKVSGGHVYHTVRLKPTVDVTIYWIFAGERVCDHCVHSTAHAIDHCWPAWLVQDTVVPNCAAKRAE